MSQNNESTEVRYVGPEYQDSPHNDADFAVSRVLDDRAIAAAITKLEDDARSRILPADLPEIVDAVKREKAHFQVLLERSDLIPDDRVTLVEGVRYCIQKLIELGKVAAKQNAAQRIPGYPVGTPTKDLGPRFDAAREVDILDLIETLSGQTAIKRGAKHYVRCPFHDDRNPSLMIVPDEHRWYCFVRVRRQQHRLRDALAPPERDRGAVVYRGDRRHAP